MAVDLSILRCAACGRLDAGPVDFCTACGCADLARIPVAGRGRLASWTVIRRAPLRFRADAPYVIAVVDLECGARVAGRLVAEPPRNGIPVETVCAAEWPMFAPAG